MLRKLFALLSLTMLLYGCSLNSSDTIPSTVSTQAQETTQESTTAPETTTVPETTAATEPVFDAYAIVDTMTTEELAGQLFLARHPDTEAQALADLEAYHLGGYIFFARDFELESPDSVLGITSVLQSSSQIPLLIAVDEEGGTVTRISRYPQYRETPFPSPRSLYEEGGLELLVRTEEEKCLLLRSLGINVNMAPVCDITTDPSAFMYRRSLGLSPDETGTAVAAMVRTMQESQVGSVLKHFPGYGNNTDTHVGIAVDSRSLEELEGADLIPFRAGIDAGCSAVLVSHTIVEALDPELPASLSPAVISYLRQEMGFDGVVVTDDLVMQAITDRYGAGEAAVLAVLAGCDLLCSTEYGVQYAAVLEAVESGRIEQSLLRNAAARIIDWKYALGLLEDPQI